MAPRLKYSNTIIDIVGVTGSERSFNSYEDSFNEVKDRKSALSGVSDDLIWYDEQVITCQARGVHAQIVQELDVFYDNIKDGTIRTFEIWRDYNLGAYINFEGGLNTNDGGVGTFTHSGFANEVAYQRRSDGLYVFNELDSPRFPAGKYGNGIIIERAIENTMQIDTNDFITNWTNSGGGFTRSANTTETKDPFGTNLADKLEVTGATGVSDFDTGVASGNTVTWSFFIKSAVGNARCEMEIFGASSGSETSGEFNATPSGDDGNGFTRVNFTADTSAFSGDVQLRLIVYDTDDVVYCFGSVFEDDKSYMGSFNLNTDEEELTYVATGMLDQNKGTIAFWFKPLWLGSTSAGVSTVSDAHFIDISNGTNRFMDFRVASNASTAFYNLRILNSVGVTTINAAPPQAITTDWHYVVFTWNSETGAVAIYVDGVSIVSGGTTAFSPRLTQSVLNVGSDLNGANQADAVMDEIGIYRDVKNATWALQGYNYGRGKGRGRNYFSSAILDSYRKSEGKNGFYDIELKFREEKT